MLFSFATNTVKKHLNERKDKISNKNIQDSSLLNPFTLVIAHTKNRFLKPKQWLRKKRSLEPSVFTLNDILIEDKKEKFDLCLFTRTEAEAFEETLTIRQTAPKWKEFSREYQVDLTAKESLFVHLKFGNLKATRVNLLDFSKHLTDCKVKMDHPFVVELRKQKCPLFVITDIVYLVENAAIELNRGTSFSKSETVVKIGLNAETCLMYGLRRLEIRENGDLVFEHIFNDDSYCNSFVRGPRRTASAVERNTNSPDATVRSTNRNQSNSQAAAVASAPAAGGNSSLNAALQMEYDDEIVEPVVESHPLPSSNNDNNDDNDDEETDEHPLEEEQRNETQETPRQSHRSSSSSSAVTPLNENHGEVQMYDDNEVPLKEQSAGASAEELAVPSRRHSGSLSEHEEKVEDNDNNYDEVVIENHEEINQKEILIEQEEILVEQEEITIHEEIIKNHLEIQRQNSNEIREFFGRENLPKNENN